MAKEPVSKSPRPKKADKAPGKRNLKKAAHRDKLIDATIQSIAQHGYAGTTVSTIQTMSGLSRGMINLHFSSKEALFRAALSRLADHYETFWRAALIKAGSQPSRQLVSLVKNNLSDEVLKSEMLPVWYAFRAEAHTHPEYLDLYSARDTQYSETLNTICLKLALKQGEDERYAKDSASGISAMVEGFWVDAFLHPKKFDRTKAVRILRAFIRSRFPKSYQ